MAPRPLDIAVIDGAGDVCFLADTVVFTSLQEAGKGLRAAEQELEGDPFQELPGTSLTRCRQACVGPTGPW